MFRLLRVQGLQGGEPEMSLSSAGCGPPGCSHQSDKTGFGLMCQAWCSWHRLLSNIISTSSSVVLGRADDRFLMMAWPVLKDCKMFVNSGVWALQRGLLAGNLGVDARSRRGIRNMPACGGEAAIGMPVPCLHPSSGSVLPISNGVSFRGAQRTALATQKRNELPHPDLCNGLCQSTGMGQGNYVFSSTGAVLLSASTRVRIAVASTPISQAYADRQENKPKRILLLMLIFISLHSMKCHSSALCGTAWLYLSSH